MSDRRSPGAGLSAPPRADDGSWHRWQMNDLGREHREQRMSDDHAQRQARHQAQERERTQALASQQARQEGHDAGHAEGREAGYRAGYEEGLKAAQAVAELEFDKRVTLTLTPLADLATTFRQALAALDDDIANQLVELALITGRQLAGESLAARPEHILSIVRELFEADTSLNGRTRLWLHPEDLPLVESTLGDTLAAAGWECHADHALERGGCRATSASGGLDASLDTQWKAILDQRRRRRPSTEESETPVGDAPDADASGNTADE